MAWVTVRGQLTPDRGQAVLKKLTAPWMGCRFGLVGLLGGASCTQLVHRLTRFYLHCLCGRVIVSAADLFVAGLAVSGVAHGYRTSVARLPRFSVVQAKSPNRGRRHGSGFSLQMRTLTPKVLVGCFYPANVPYDVTTWGWVQSFFWEK